MWDGSHAAGGRSKGNVWPSAAISVERKWGTFADGFRHVALARPDLDADRRLSDYSGPRGDIVSDGQPGHHGDVCGRPERQAVANAAGDRLAGIAPQGDVPDPPGPERRGQI